MTVCCQSGSFLFWCCEGKEEEEGEGGEEQKRPQLEREARFDRLPVGPWTATGSGDLGAPVVVCGLLRVSLISGFSRETKGALARQRSRRWRLRSYLRARARARVGASFARSASAIVARDACAEAPNEERAGKPAPRIPSSTAARLSQLSSGPRPPCHGCRVHRRSPAAVGRLAPDV